MLAQGRGNEMLDTLYERYEAYARGRQLVLVEGTHEDGPVGAPEQLMSVDSALLCLLRTLPMLKSCDGMLVLTSRSCNGMADGDPLFAMRRFYNVLCVSRFVALGNSSWSFLEILGVNQFDAAFMLTLALPHAGVPSNRLELNGRVAATLSSPVLAVIDARAGATAGSLFNIASIAIDSLKGCGAEVLGVALNRVCRDSICL